MVRLPGLLYLLVRSTLAQMSTTYAPPIIVSGAPRKSRSLKETYICKVNLKNLFLLKPCCKGGCSLMVPWADVSDGGNQLRCTSYCTLGKLHFRQIAQIAAHKLAADKSVDSLQIQYTIDQDQRSAMQITNQEHMWHPKCKTKCSHTITMWTFEYWLRVMKVSRLCAQICTPSDQTALL